MWFGELCSCYSKPVLRSSAWVLPNYVLQTLFLSSANFCLTLCLNLYRTIGSGLYVRRLIHPPAFIASKTVPQSLFCKSPKMMSLFFFITLFVASVKMTGAQVQCEVPGECLGQLLGFTQENDTTR